MTGHNVIRYVDEDGNATYDLVPEVTPHPRHEPPDGESLMKPNAWNPDLWANTDD